jgi:excisionase family DNA binding protein
MKEESNTNKKAGGNAKDVCRMLHVSTRTLQKWRKQGKIPFIRLKGKILYRESEVLRLLEQVKL